MAKQSARLDDVRVVEETAESLLCLIGEKQLWVPMRYVWAASEVWTVGDRGTLVIPRWFAARVGRCVVECAAWGLAKAITRGTIWHGAALTYRERVLGEDGLPLWVRAPRIPPPLLPTRALVRWLAQVEP